MRRTVTNALAIAVVPLLTPGTALAHAGHVAEVAGHAHWVALGAALAAGAIAAALAASGKKAKTDDAEPDVETEGETA